MKVGLFDHVEQADRSLATLYDERLTFAAAADDAGIYCLHVAEHHCTPLNMVPVPGVYLAAVARGDAAHAPRAAGLSAAALFAAAPDRRDLHARPAEPRALRGRRRSRRVARSSSNITRSITTSRATSSSTRSTASAPALTPRELHATRALFQLQGRADAAAAVAATASGVLVRLVQRDRRDLGRRARHAFRQPRADRVRQAATSTPSRRRSPSAAAPPSPKAEFRGGAAIGVLRNIVVADTRCRGAADRRAGLGASPRHAQLAAQQARLVATTRRAPQRAARRDARGKSRRRDADRRHARHRASRRSSARPPSSASTTCCRICSSAR